MDEIAPIGESNACTLSTLDVFLLGVVDFESALGLQARLLTDLAGRLDPHGILLVCEHPPAISIGREGHSDDVLVEDLELRAREIGVRWLSRGGGTVLHGPGQVAVYTLLPLERLGLNLTGFRQGLEQGLIAMARDLEIDAYSVGTAPGTAPGAACRCGQFGFIGAGVRDSISYGGVYINVSMPGEVLETVRWSADSGAVTSLATQRTRPTSMASVRESIVRHLADQFGYSDYHVYTGHPLLHRTVRPRPAPRV